MATWLRTWSGGRVRQGPRGSERFVIERRVRGKGRMIITLEVDSEKQALAELALFERDPTAYQTRAQVRAAQAEGAVRVDFESISGFLRHLAGKNTDERPRSEGYRKNVRSYLGWWAEVLEGRDLRSVKLKHLHVALDSALTARKHRIIALKSFCSWLRHRGELERQFDATLDLQTPGANRLQKIKGYPMHRLESLYPFVEMAAVRCVLVIRSRTSMHHSEIDRLARGEGEIVPLPDQGEIAGVFYFDHKKGAPHIVSVDLQTLAAGQALRRRGSAPVHSYVHKQLDLAADEASRVLARPIQTIRPGELRHSYEQWSENFGREVYPARRGVPLAVVSATMGHNSTETTHRFYRGLRIPVLISLPLKLEHPGDAPAELNRDLPHPLAERLAR